MVKNLKLGATGAALLGLAALLGTAHAEDITLKGDVVDSYCYSSMGAHGASHRACGLKCAKKGIPMALATDGGKKLYVLLPAKDKGSTSYIAKHIDQTVTIKGEEYDAGGVRFLRVKSIQ